MKVTAENLTDAQLRAESRRLIDIPDIFEQARDSADRQLLAAVIEAEAYETHHWIRDGRCMEARTAVAAAINARAKGGG